MKIFDGFAAGQPTTESHRLDGCLTEIQTDTLGYHRVNTTPLGLMAVRILQG
jgi:hypothetical protein